MGTAVLAGLMLAGTGPAQAAGALAPTAELAAAPLAATTTPVLRQGSRGAAVRTLQTRLTGLGYWLGTVDGVYGPLTTQAVMALQKAAGISRDGIAGPQTQSALTRKVRPAARTTSGLVVEVSLSKQLLLVVRNGSVQRILNTSTGTGRTYVRPDGSRGTAITPKGTFTVFRQIDGWRTSPLGELYRPKYFTTSGVAVHGATSIPAYPASHGCVRVSLRAMDMLWSTGALPIGGKVRVY